MAITLGLLSYWQPAEPLALLAPAPFVKFLVVIMNPVVDHESGVLRRSLSDFLSFGLDATGLAQLNWRDFGNGLEMARLARAEKSELVLYRIAADASAGAFLKHEHIGGEFYIVLQGKIVDENGEYATGDVVFLDPGSVHTPRAIGETVVLVLWPAGVRLVD